MRTDLCRHQIGHIGIFGLRELLHWILDGGDEVPLPFGVVRTAAVLALRRALPETGSGDRRRAFIGCGYGGRFPGNAVKNVLVVTEHDGGDAECQERGGEDGGNAQAAHAGEAVSGARAARDVSARAVSVSLPHLLSHPSRSVTANTLLSSLTDRHGPQLVMALVLLFAPCYVHRRGVRGPNSRY